jgi:GxxExxY protein
MTQMATDMRDARTGAIIGAAMEAHRQLGHGFLEPVYQEALALELAARGIPFQREPQIAITYKGQILSCTYRADFVCYNDILLELKALSAVGGIEQAQVLHYLKASGLRLGLLVNFGAPRLQVKRLVFDTHLCASVKSVDNPDSVIEE